MYLYFILRFKCRIFHDGSHVVLLSVMLPVEYKNAPYCEKNSLENIFYWCLLFFFLRGTLEESAYMFQLLGLNLLSLLAQNRLAEFHTVSKNTHYL